VPLSPGLTIGNYEVIAALGEGGMASVWSARHIHLDSKHALKVLDPALISSKDLRARFLNEGRIQAQIRHPNLVAVTDVVVGASLAVLVMDYAPGESLRTRLDGGWRASADEALAIMLPILDGLAYAHEHGVVHRDIKPSNIILGEAPRGGPMPRLIDFGVAKVDEAGAVSTSGAKGATRTGARIGTTEYMAPEQVRGLSDLDARADVYAVGVTLFEILTGHTPFDGQDDFELMKAIVESEPPDVRRSAPDVPASLAAAIGKALSKSRGDRHTSADALKAALANTPPVAPAPAIAAAPVATPRPPSGPPTASPAPARPWWPALREQALAGQAPLWFAAVAAGVSGLFAGIAYNTLYYKLNDPLDHWVTLGLIWPLLITAPLWLVARPRWLKASAVALAAGLVELGGEEGLGAMLSIGVVALAVPDQPLKGRRFGQAFLSVVLTLGAIGLLVRRVDSEIVAYAMLFAAVWVPALGLLAAERSLGPGESG